MVLYQDRLQIALPALAPVDERNPVIAFPLLAGPDAPAAPALATAIVGQEHAQADPGRHRCVGARPDPFW